MSTSSGRCNRFTSCLTDYYPSSQFEKLSHRLSHKKNKHNNNPVSPREEIYLSLLKEIRSKQAPKLGALVKKASGILRLCHLHPEFSSVSKSSSTGSEFKKTRSQVGRKKFEKSQSQTQTLVGGLSAKGLQSSDIISKLAANGGEFSEIWDYIEATSQKGEQKISKSRPPSRRSQLSSTSTSSRETNASKVYNKKPPWRYFGVQKGLSVNSNTSVVSSEKSNTSSIDVGDIESLSSVNSGNKWSKTTTCETKAGKKADYMRHVFVINGKVVTFRGQGFENFTNWFGDVALLSDSNVRRNCRLRREFNLAGFTNQEIRMKIYEGYKLVIEAYRSSDLGRQAQPPMRFKETIILPKDVSVEKLMMCRYESGRLVVLDASQDIIR